MKIGLDLDGVVIDSEQTFRTYEEIFDIEKHQNKLINREEPKFQGRYSWILEEQQEFCKYFLEISKNSPLMPGFKKVYELLKETEYIKEANNWGDIYRFIIERCDKYEINRRFRKSW